MITLLFYIGIVCIVVPTGYVANEAMKAFHQAKLYNRGWQDSATIAGNLGAFEDLSDEERAIYMQGRRDGWKARVASLQSRRLG